MILQPVQRKKQRIRISFQGDVSTGKTLSALLFAYGITYNWSKIAVIDTEQNSASFYNHLGPFNVVQIGAPFSTQKYCDAIELCENAQMEVIIIDSISPEWVDEGGILYQYAAASGDKVDKYDAVMPNHHTFISYIQKCQCHVIATVRSSEDRVFQQKDYEHHFTTVLKLDKEHQVSVVRDRTGIFNSQCPCFLNEAKGAQILEWCNEGEDSIPIELQRQISACKSLPELSKLLVKSDIEDVSMISAFTKRRLELEGLANGKLANGRIVPFTKVH